MMGFDLILIVAVIAYALGWRPQFNQTRPTQTSQTPLELLKERYARGKSAAKSSSEYAWIWKAKLQDNFDCLFFKQTKQAVLS